MIVRNAMGQGIMQTLSTSQYRPPIELGYSAI